MAYIRTQVPTQVRGRTLPVPVAGGAPLQRRRPRLEADAPRNTVQVRAKDEKMAKALNYVMGNSGRVLFDANGVAEWPRDQFTLRRLRDGDVTLVEAPGEKKDKESKRVTHRAEQGPT